jgi:hypothetical protein
MSLLKFDYLSLEQKIKYACYGQFVQTINYSGFIVQLYSMPDGSFCEVFCHQEQNEIIRVAICNDDDLKKFLTDSIIDF